MGKAIERAKAFAQWADENDRSKPLGNKRVVWLTKKQADWLAELLREEELSYTVKEGFGLFPSEKFRELSDATFWAKLSSTRTEKGSAQMFFRRVKKTPVLKRKKPAGRGA